MYFCQKYCFEMNNETTIISFDDHKIRKIWHDDQWYFSVVDVIDVLTDSKNPSVYWSALKKRENESFTFCKRLNIPRANGKNYPTDCANTEGVLRIVMSVPSPKAEPLKLWLAQTGAERIEETENPELAYERMKELYLAKGYSEKWIKERLQTIATRKQLTDEWKNRGVKEGQEYSILTATIAKGTFGLTPSEHAKYKDLEKENLRDHMTGFELILTALSEEATRFLTVRDDAQGFNENLDAAALGGHIGGTARQNLERQLGESVVSKENHLKKLGDRKTNELPENTEGV
jgi:DNA-damage-inducible protein D